MNIKVEQYKDGRILLKASSEAYEILPKGKCVLYLPDSPPRYIGTWDEEKKEYRRTVNGKKHVHKKSRSFAFPYVLIGFLVQRCGLERLVVSTREGEYVLSISDILGDDGRLDRRKAMVARYEGFEAQIFIPQHLFTHREDHSGKEKKRRQPPPPSM